MERRGFFKHLVGQLAQAASGAYVVPLGNRNVVFYEGENQALPLWLAPATTGAFVRVCHATSQAITGKALTSLAEKTSCQFTRIFASDPAQKADAYILFSPKLGKLPNAPTLLLFTPKEIQKLVAKLPEILQKLPRGSDVFVGNLEDWQQPGSPIHGRIQLFLSQLK